MSVQVLHPPTTRNCVFEMYFEKRAFSTQNHHAPGFKSPPSPPTTLVPLFDLMGDYHRAKLLAPDFLAHDGAVRIIGKPQTLDSIVAHESAEGALRGSAILGRELGLGVTAYFGIDEAAVGELELGSAVGAVVGVFAVCTEFKSESFVRSIWGASLRSWCLHFYLKIFIKTQ